MLYNMFPNNSFYFPNSMPNQNSHNFPNSMFNQNSLFFPNRLPFLNTMSTELKDKIENGFGNGTFQNEYSTTNMQPVNNIFDDQTKFFKNFIVNVERNYQTNTKKYNKCDKCKESQNLLNELGRVEILTIYFVNNEKINIYYKNEFNDKTKILCCVNDLQHINIAEEMTIPEKKEILKEFLKILKNIGLNKKDLKPFLILIRNMIKQYCGYINCDFLK